MKKYLIVCVTAILSACTTTHTSHIVDNGRLLSVRFTHSQGSLTPSFNGSIDPQKAPKPDSQGVFGLGVGQALHAEQATQSAKAMAKKSIVSNLMQVLYGPMTNKEKQQQPDQFAYYQTLISNIVAPLPDKDFSEVDVQVQEKRNRALAQVVLKLTYSNFNHLLEQQKSWSRNQGLNSALSEFQARLSSHLPR